MKILVVNAGSSSHKLSLFDSEGGLPTDSLWRAQLDWGRPDNQYYTVQVKGGEKVTRHLKTPSLEEGLREVLESLWKGDAPVIDTPLAIGRVGHRVVHGGAIFQCPVLVTRAVKEEIRRLIPLAPLHNPGNLEGIELIEQIFPAIPQIAVFDTAFHSTMPEVVKTYPVPYEWKEKGIQRYGFHGTSHHYCAIRATEMMKSRFSSLRLVNCHLGNGASLCAIRDGKSIDTTMGFTPLEGLMMGTRCGSIDPGILLYAMRELNVAPKELDTLLTFESGLKGIGGSSDMREIQAETSERAELALNMYIYRLKYFIGAMTASLGGIDVLSFTAGIGEHAAYIREKTCEGLAYLGVRLDLEKNHQDKSDQDLDIAASDSAVRILVIHTQEEWMIAKGCLDALL
ncbi:acetate kinase [Candidatus Protochlamydia naegleriophila]|uniref:Acetate kinase n=1 Tax=Candidatus Protochlamydia naegleriophila TaxID=389348 RepID=A0A0U5K1Q5_9BACT|nr:acetate kinase [Candidatus Protochlamydia naegleriophila]CUI16011.1 acetate kinase [Candidatus Protochlamydia naegleriophila]